MFQVGMEIKPGLSFASALNGHHRFIVGLTQAEPVAVHRVNLLWAFRNIYIYTNAQEYETGSDTPLSLNMEKDKYGKG